jgi:hypothetical protein
MAHGPDQSGEWTDDRCPPSACGGDRGLMRWFEDQRSSHGSREEVPCTVPVRIDSGRADASRCDLRRAAGDAGVADTCPPREWGSRCWHGHRRRRGDRPRQLVEQRQNPPALLQRCAGCASGPSLPQDGDDRTRRRRILRRFRSQVLHPRLRRCSCRPFGAVPRCRLLAGRTCLPSAAGRRQRHPS